MTLSTDIAQAILDGFDKHYSLFRERSRLAKDRFERAAWDEVHEAQRKRIGMYDQRVEEAVAAVKARFPNAGSEEALWKRIKVEYIGLLYEKEHKQPECAETFFNSVTRRLLDRRYYDNALIFARPAVSTEHLDGDEPVYDCYYPESTDLVDTFRAIVKSFGFANPMQDLERDVGYMQRAVMEFYPGGWERHHNFQIQVLRSAFFRNKAAYIVGRVINGSNIFPFIVPLLKDAEGRIYIDTVVLAPREVGRVFSLGRAYFMVDMEVPSAYVEFLASVAPAKPKPELYTLVGLQKQGKTLFFRDLMQHLKASSDTFVLAPGTKGMVMLVFTLPSYPYVFKVIRDWFEPPKDADRKLVEAKYDYVKLADRVGRMADTLEFAHVAFPKHRLDPALLDEIVRLAPKTVEVTDDTVVVEHLYIERRLTPLNLYLEKADENATREAIIDYGNAIRELANANIFPGDLLLKNFGLTRFGRVVFYDYDEICEVTECRFRRMPKPRNEDDEIASDPWFMVEANDIFPEQFPTFLLPPGRPREIFMEAHGDLADPATWIALQDRVRAGVQDDLYPYPQDLRFSQRYGGQ
ncbi:MAG: bifunctional isocitrate dehydrogenase kinase/phosphatase [Deltaproteobacteria bacterium]|nr:bifunctional isocitrate dehydrogenase kinase/phosphatase [Deltaproteobacteria bacterium]